MEMKDKLLELLKRESLKSGQFAEMLGVNPAGISHILSGRNKPGFDLLQKILRQFPNLNPDWLILDSEQMYREKSQSAQTTSPNLTAPLFKNSEKQDKSLETNQDRQIETKIPNHLTPPQKDPIPSIPREQVQKKVIRVVFCYNDGTFETFQQQE